MLKLEACLSALGCLRATATGSSAKNLTPFVGAAFLLLFIAALIWVYAQHRRKLGNQYQPLRPNDVSRLAVGF